MALLLGTRRVLLGIQRVPALDGKTDVCAAYSLRKLRSAYTGSAIRVRRSSDNAETDIGFDSSGNLDIAALLSHCGAGSGFIVNWYDQTANVHTLTQSTTADQPRIVNSGVLDIVNNGRPAIVFDGSTDSLAGSVTNAGAAWTFISAAKRNAGGAAYTAIWNWGFSDVAGAEFAITGGVYADWLADDSRFCGDGYESGQNPRFIGTGPENLVDAAPVVWDGTLASGTATLRRNGGAITARASNSSTAPVTGSQTLTIGAHPGPQNLWPGSICEVILFEADHEADLAALRADVIAYYWWT